MTPRPMLTPKNIETAGVFARNLRDPDSLHRQLLRFLLLLTATPLVLLWKFPLLFGVAVVVVLAYGALGGWGLLLVLLAPPVVFVFWRMLHPASADRVAGYLHGAWRYRRIYRRHWRTVTTACGLAGRGPAGESYPPRLVRVIAHPAMDAVHVRMLAGQSPADYIAHADDLAHAFGSAQVRVRSDRPGTVTLLFSTGDLLTEPIPAMPLGPETVDFEALPVAVTEDGRSYELRLLYTHVLTAGATGAGKGSVLWSTVRALAPAVPSGVLELWGADPKGGIELAIGRALFTRFAADDEPGDMVQLVTDAATLVRERSKRLRGHTRKHTPTTDEPFVVLVIDELAYLSEYQTDPKVRARFNADLKIVLSQGRAAGVSVLAFVQDPRKSVVDARNLFPTKVALRLDSTSEVEMLLGKDALERGAHCEAIPMSQPGTGYVLIDGDPTPVRLRFAWVSDDDIRAMAQAYPAPPPAPPRHGFTVVTDTDGDDQADAATTDGEKPAEGAA